MFARNTSFDASTSWLLLGPRGTGKSYWLRHRFPDAVYIDLLDSNYYNALLANPGRLENYIPPESSAWIIVDEIQKIPALMDEIHRLIEQRNLRFILTGSSARKLRGAGSNLLGGRAVSAIFHPFSVDELGDSFSLEKALRHGLLPSLYDEEKDLDPDLYLKNYVHTYLKEEVFQEGLSRNLPLFARFLEAASFSQGETLNISETARESGIKRKMAESYFGILEDLLIACRIPVFSRRAKRRLVQHAKFYFFDTGVFRAIRPRGPLDSAEEIDGAALETLVLQNMRAILSHTQSDSTIHYWRTSNGTEVDFVVYGSKVFLAIEVKRKQILTPRDLRGLKAFLEDYPDASACIFYGGAETLYFDQITAMPIELALRQLPKLLAGCAS